MSALQVNPPVKIILSETSLLKSSTLFFTRASEIFRVVGLENVQPKQIIASNIIHQEIPHQNHSFLKVLWIGVRVITPFNYYNIAVIYQF
jgi:hypothetical protein